MVSVGRAVLYGFLIWLIAFAVAFAIFPIRESWRALFESIMPVVLAASTVVFARLYFRRVQQEFVSTAFKLGVIWMVVNVAVDLPLMLPEGPMQMTLSEYIGDIGLTYLIIPIITVGMGLARAQNNPASAGEDA